MRVNKRIISLALCVAVGMVTICTGNGGTNAGAKMRNMLGIKNITKAASGESIATTTAAVATTPSVTEEPENIPTVSPEVTSSATPGATESAAPEATDTATPPAATTEPPQPTDDVKITYSVGDTFSRINYKYRVVTAPSASSKGTVKVVGLTAQGLTKKTLTVQDSVTRDGYDFDIVGIGEKSFVGNNKLQNVTIGKNVTYIGVRAFQKITSLKKVVMNNSITKIRKYAFGGCSSLRTIVIPYETEIIETRAFNNCKKLKAVYIQSTKISSINSYAFANNISSRYFVVPSGKKTAYKKMLSDAKTSNILIYTY